MATDLRGKTALVTGASSGIGAALARQLAARGANLIVVARREAELEALAAAVKAAHQVEVTVIALDLATPTAAAALFARTEDAGHPVDVLVNNAGFGEHQYFVEQAWGRVAQQLQLNIVTLTELSHRFGQAMAARGRGHILNVASIGAYTPAPTYATYSAGKAYVRDFTEAIAHELAPRGVRVCCLCPGGTVTEFHLVAGQTVPGWMRAFAFMSADRCAAIGLRALLGWRRNVVAGVPNKIGMWTLRFVPRRMIVWIAARSMGRPRLPAST
ncbi:MAG: SDR family NAD(P)-dependent oxidoreductase [Myxococcales bacterium]|nr:SDR family NAD(P)-dependent oxidoreductase [Myxococcales bacterium]